jgi:hypothetical protein
MTQHYMLADLVNGEKVADVTLTHGIETAQGARLVAAFFGKRPLLVVPTMEGRAQVWTEDA